MISLSLVVRSSVLLFRDVSLTPESQLHPYLKRSPRTEMGSAERIPEVKSKPVTGDVEDRGAHAHLAMILFP